MNDAGSGIETVLERIAPWPPWVTILLGLAAVVYTFGLYLRERTEYHTWTKLALALMRCTLIWGVLWMMYGFTIRPFRTNLPDVLVLLDDSASMATVDGPENTEFRAALDGQIRALGLGEASRLNQAKLALLAHNGKLLRFLHDNYQLRLGTLKSSDIESGDDLETLQAAIRGVSATGDQSQLGKVVRRALQRQRGRPVAAVVLFTDGITTEGQPLAEVAREAKQRNIPLHLVGLGSQQPATDLRLVDLLVDDVVFLGDVITFDVTLHASGFPNQAVEVTLRTADRAEPVMRQQVQLNQPRDSKPVRLAYRPEEKGVHEFVIETQPQEEEVRTDNNSLRCQVDVRDDTTHVLLVQSYPSYEFHYLKTLLGRQQTEVSGARRQPIDLHVLLQDADPEFAEIDATALRSFPTADELLQYDVCIFGDVNPSFLSAETMANLRDFVRDRGRGFVGIAGPRYFPDAFGNTPIRELVPFDTRNALAPPAELPIQQGFRLALTPLAQRLPFMQLSIDPDTNQQRWSELPELYWLLEVDAWKPSVHILTEHPSRTTSSGRPLPVTMLSYVGAGKVLFHATDDSWRWRIQRGDELYGRYWLQAIRYLSRFKLGEGRQVELTTNRETYRVGDVVRLRARFFDDRQAPVDDDGVSVMLEQQGRGQQRVSLRRDAAERGIFRADIPNLGTGQYHAWISDPVFAGQAPACDFGITAPDTEMTRLEMDVADLEDAAHTSGGEFYTIESVASLAAKLPVGRQVRIEALPPEPVWNSWLVALLFISLLISEWLLRRRLGLV